MIPLRDTQRSRTAPVVVVSLVVINCLVFLHEAALGPYLPHFVFAYGLVPLRFTTWQGGPLDAARFLPLLTSMFWHGGWLHLLGNMLYLWVFGDNVEDRLGHVRFLVFYLVCGALAGLTQVALDPYSRLPTVGASGAIAGVLGAYLVAFPRAKVITWPFFFIPIPAFIYLVIWFVAQLFDGLGSLGAPTQGGGVAVWAHIGGFIAGAILMKLLAPRRLTVRGYY
ncbi:MAG TPA: rhomboid family intramembrane serine protease [Myxococcales bacterium]|jgi:membrane associated rhomboid family serine protease